MNRVRSNRVSAFPHGPLALCLLISSLSACGDVEEPEGFTVDAGSVTTPPNPTNGTDGSVPPLSTDGAAPSTQDGGRPPVIGSPEGGPPVADGGGSDGATLPIPVGDAAVPTPPGDLSVFRDPGAEPWKVVPEAEVAAKCKLDINLLKGLTMGSGFAVARYGQLCYQKPATDRPSQMYSSTKTLGAVVTGIASYETRNIPRTGKKTGQLKDSDEVLHWLDSVSYNREANLAHVLSMVGHNSNLADGSKVHSYDALGSVQINTLSTMVRTAISQDSTRLATSTGAFAKKFLFDVLGMRDSSWGGTQYATSWTATLGDMARLGTLIIHQGVWSGKRVLDAGWIYKMTHPAFEDGNTAYGYLTWLVAREGARSIGGGSFTSNSSHNDTCAPAAVWQRYPHGLSTFKDCTYKTSSCTQKHDVGIWSAQGLNGQFIVGHAGLDLVIVAKNYSGSGGPAGMWKEIRPALIAHDPIYKGNEAEFCKAYAAGDYAPDLPAPVVQPTE